MCTVRTIDLFLDVLRYKDVQITKMVGIFSILSIVLQRALIG